MSPLVPGGTQTPSLPLQHPYLEDSSWWASPGQVCLSARGRKALLFSWPLTPWTMTLSPVHCFLSGGISALEDAVFCVTPAAAHTSISHIPVSSCPDSAGYQPGPRLFVERQRLRTAKGGSRKWEAIVPPWSESRGLLCGARGVCSEQCTHREPAQDRHVRRFHSEGDTPFDLGLHPPQLVSP